MTLHGITKYHVISSLIFFFVLPLPSPTVAFPQGWDFGQSPIQFPSQIAEHNDRRPIPQQNDYMKNGGDGHNPLHRFDLPPPPPPFHTQFDYDTVDRQPFNYMNPSSLPDITTSSPMAMQISADRKEDRDSGEDPHKIDIDDLFPSNDPSQQETPISFDIDDLTGPDDLALASSSLNLASSPLALSPGPLTLSSSPPNLASSHQALVSSHQALASSHQALVSSDQALASSDLDFDYQTQSDYLDDYEDDLDDFDRLNPPVSNPDSSYYSTIPHRAKPRRSKRPNRNRQRLRLRQRIKNKLRLRQKNKVRQNSIPRPVSEPLSLKERLKIPLNNINHSPNALHLNPPNKKGMMRIQVGLLAPVPVPSPVRAGLNYMGISQPTVYGSPHVGGPHADFSEVAPKFKLPPEVGQKLASNTDAANNKFRDNVLKQLNKMGNWTDDNHVNMDMLILTMLQEYVDRTEGEKAKLEAEDYFEVDGEEESQDEQEKKVDDKEPFVKINVKEAYGNFVKSVCSMWTTMEFGGSFCKDQQQNRRSDVDVKNKPVKIKVKAKA